MPVTRACGALGLSTSTWYRPASDSEARDAPIMDALNEVVTKHPRWGFWKCFYWLRQHGHEWNHKRVHRVYCELRLNLPRRTKRRVPQRLRQPLAAPPVLNGTWALDFMQDALYGGRRFRTLNVIDEGNRQGLAIEIGTSIPSARLVRLMEQLIDLYGRPAALRVDNGPELTAEAFVEWCRRKDIEVRYIQPGKPDQNAYIERFNRSYREEVLSAYVFESIEQVQLLTDEWLTIYNEQRPHDSLGRVPPLTFMPRPDRPVESGYRVST